MLGGDCADGEAPIWKWLKTVVETLGHEGMSSDESEPEEDDMDITYRVKLTPWRRVIDKELTIIDSARKFSSGFARSGAKPVRRIRDHKLLSTRPPVKGLPRSFYDDWWIQSDKKRILMVEAASTHFKWMNLITDGDEAPEREVEDDNLVGYGRESSGDDNDDENDSEEEEI
jgi:hypothetical protein